MELLPISEETITKDEKNVVKLYKFSFNGKIFEIYEHINDMTDMVQENHQIHFKNYNITNTMTCTSLILKDN